MRFVVGGALNKLRMKLKLSVLGMKDQEDRNEIGLATRVLYVELKVRIRVVHSRGRAGELVTWR